MSVIRNLEDKLKDVQIDTEPDYGFVPKVHDHHDLNRWFCESLQALSTADSTKLYQLANGMRKSVWDTVQSIEPVDKRDIEHLTPQITSLIKEMVRIMKFRVVSYQRTTRAVVEYTRTMIEKARKIAKAIYSQQTKLSQHIQAQAQALKHEKISQLPYPEDDSVTIHGTQSHEPGFEVAFQVVAQGTNSKKATMDTLKKKAIQLYTELAQLREDRVHAVLSHDKPKVRTIDQRTRKIKTQTRAITGARQHLASVTEDDQSHVLAGGQAKQTTQEAIDRLTNAMTKKKVTDYDMYRHEVQNQIDEHTDGMALYLNLKTQKEIVHLQRDLQTEVCKVVAQMLESGRHEVILLNQEMASMHSQLIAMEIGKEGVEYLEKMAKKYRASIARIQLELLALFDKR
jgi:hypothetical protein